MISKKIKHNTKNAGFTLIELLVVIAIIGLLSSVVLVALASAKDKANNTVALQELHQVQLAMEFYYQANGNYPNPNTAGVGKYCIGGSTCKDSSGNTVTDYFSFKNDAASYIAGSHTFFDEVATFFEPNTVHASGYASPSDLVSLKKLVMPITYYCSYYLISPGKNYCPAGYVWLTYPQKSGNTSTYYTTSASAIVPSTY